MKYLIQYENDDSEKISQELEWEACVDIILAKEPMTVIIRIPVTDADFGLNCNEKEVQRIIRKGYIDVYASKSFMQYNVLALYYTIIDGDCGDEDGFGRSKPLFLRAFTNMQGKLLTQLAVTFASVNYTIDTWIKEQKNPFAPDGSVIPHPTIDIENDLNEEEWFEYVF